MKIAIAGLGTVGGEVLRQLLANASRYEKWAGGSIKVVAVSARDRRKDRGVDLRKSGIRWFSDPVTMARSADAQVVVELIGGADGIARRVVETAIACGRHVVTANKALLAHHGMELARLAEMRQVTIAFEAAVAGGIPVIEVLRQGLAVNRLNQVVGILNGTTNFILTEMWRTGRGFSEVLKEAQQRGYAEADPTLDVSGMDAAHKLAILSSLGFGVQIDLAGVHVEGIQHITAQDITFARELGFRVKLLAIARMTEYGLEQRVHPCMVPEGREIAKVDDVLNAVAIQGEPVGTIMLQGRGAGAGPTASAVLADITDLVTGRRLPAFVLPAHKLRAASRRAMGDHTGEYYLRFMVADEPGVLHQLTGALAAQGVSVAQVIQRGRTSSGAVPLMFITASAKEAAVQRALRMIAELPSVVEKPCLIRIERGV